MAKNILNKKSNSAIEKYKRRVRQADSLVCVGLDADYALIPERFKKNLFPQFAFNRWVIEQTHSLVSAFKFNLAFYEARGDRGIRELRKTMDYMRQRHPDIFTIGDGKRGDVVHTNQQSASFLFDWLGFDAVTLNPYLGREALTPFLERKERASIILCRTSNPGGGELQKLSTKNGPLWEVVARRVSREWNEHKNCLVVLGGTGPEEIKKMRELDSEMIFLIPGVGRQGGSIEKVVRAGRDQDGGGLIISSSREIIFARDPRRVTGQLKNEINKFRYSF